MTANPFRRDPADREHLARLLPAPAERDLPGGRATVYREFLMHQIDQPDTTPAADSDRSTRPSGRIRRLAPVGALAVAVATALAFGPALLGRQPVSPAWAVEEGSDNSVTVRINEFTDPAGLEARLLAEGFRAVVDYIPFDKGCSNSARLHATSERLEALVTWGRSPDGGTVFTLNRGTVGPDETLSILAITAPGGADPAAFRIDVLPGAVEHCTLTDEPLLTFESVDPAFTASQPVTSGSRPAPTTEATSATATETTGAATNTG